MCRQYPTKNRYIIRKVPPDFNHGKRLPGNRTPGGTDDENGDRGREAGPGHVEEFNGRVAENITTDRSGWPHRLSKGPRKHFIYSRLQCKEKNGPLVVHCSKNRLQSDLPTAYNPLSVYTVCNQWRFSIPCNVRSHGTTRIHFFDAFVRLTPPGRRRKVSRQLGRYLQVTTTGREVFTHRMGHARTHQGSRQVFNHRNRRDP